MIHYKHTPAVLCAHKFAVRKRGINIKFSTWLSLFLESVFLSVWQKKRKERKKKSSNFKKVSTDLTVSNCYAYTHVHMQNVHIQTYPFFTVVGGPRFMQAKNLSACRNAKAFLLSHIFTFSAGGRLPRLHHYRHGHGGALRPPLRLGYPVQRRGLRVRATALRDQSARAGASVGAR